MDYSNFTYAPPVRNTNPYRAVRRNAARQQGGYIGGYARNAGFQRYTGQAIRGIAKSSGIWKTSKKSKTYIRGWFYRRFSGLVVVTGFVSKEPKERTSTNGKVFVSYSAVVENKKTFTKTNYPAWYCQADGCLYIPQAKLIVNTAKNYCKPMYDLKKR